ncbi:MAG: SDR family NAD(P)-dependent oxidoreductase [Pantoea sp.]|uniref:SDR family oxidoreductase n=1 Tax=Pantoea piersonii TaxID=2364647 RepID=UPI0028AA5C5F|nr:SDR family NAD(P)-dependent oxidoreductase [Pantoea piersonii]MDU6432252.1 SDR family NAD(P)-dependent oxidoreductase [Pantoea sp.]
MTKRGISVSAQTLKGKVALITGGGTGLSLAGAKHLAEEGAFVYIAGRRQNVLDEAIKQTGPNAHTIVADVSHKKEMVMVASVIQQEKGNLDIIFPHAGQDQR